MSVSLIICMIMLASILIIVGYKPIYRQVKRRKKRRQAKFCKKHAEGIIVSYEKEDTIDLFAIFISFLDRRHRRFSTVTEYCAVAQYIVNDRVYYVTADDFCSCRPVIGRAANIYYNPMNPSEAYLITKRKYKKKLLVKKLQDQEIVCESGLRKEIFIPVEKVTEKVRPGNIIVERYGYFHKIQDEDIKRNGMDIVKESFLSTADAMVENQKDSNISNE